MNAFNSKDLPEGSVYEANNVHFSSIGQIKPLNPIEKGLSLSQIQFGELGLSFANIAGFFRFGSDFNLGRRVMIVGHKNDSPVSDHVAFFTNKPHGLRAGMTIPIILNSDKVGSYGHAIVTYINGPYSFSIEHSDISSDSTTLSDIALNTGLTGTFTGIRENQRLILNGDLDDDTASANAAGKGSLLVENSGSNNEVMLIADMENASTPLVWRDLLEGGSFDVGSGVQINTEGYASNAIPSQSSNHTGWLYVQQTEHSDPRVYANLNYYLIMNGPHIGLYDGQSFVSNMGRLSNVKYSQNTGAFSTGYMDYNDYRENTNFNGVMPGIYYTQGGLRVSDGNYNNTLNTCNRLVKYFKARKFGIFTADSLAINNSGYSTYDDGLDTYIDVIDDAVDGKVLVDDGSSGMTLGDNEIITVRFNIVAKQSMGADSMSNVNSSEMENMPYVYWGNSNSKTPRDCESSVKKAHEGYNVMIWRATDSANDNSLHQDNLIFLAGSTDDMFCYFTNETKNVAWKVTDLEIFRTYAGVEAGWRTVDQEIYAPSNTILLEKGTTFTETNAVNSSVLYMAIDEDSTVDGDWLLNSGHRYLNFGYSFLYDDEMQESKISGMTMSGGAIYVDINGSDGNGLKGEFMINATGNNTDKFGWDSRIVGCRVYITGVDSAAITNSIDLEDPLWFATLLFDPDEKSVLFDGTRLTWAVTGQADTMKCTFTGIQEFPGLTYLLNTGYNHDEDSLYARYATACVVNNKTYIGNISYQKEGSEKWEIHADRMLQSPVGKPDVFPSSRRIDATVSDGDAIVKLMSHDNRIFQFKRHNVYIINVSEANEILEKTLNGLGILSPKAATETINGISWVNESGCYIYDGEQIQNLMKGQIDSNIWSTNFKSIATLGYSEKDQVMVCCGGNKTYIYSFKDQHWIASDVLPTNKMSNMVPAKAGGVSWIQSQNVDQNFDDTGNTESTSITNITHGTIGKKAEGKISFTSFVDANSNFYVGDESDDNVSFLNDASLYIRQGSTNVLIASGLTTISTNGYTKGWEAAMLIRNAINNYRDSNGLQIYEAFFIGEGEQWDYSDYNDNGNLLSFEYNFSSYQFCHIEIKAIYPGASFNSDATGTAGIFIGSSGQTGDLLNPVINAVGNGDAGSSVTGVNGTASSFRLNIDRNGNTNAYTVYKATSMAVFSMGMQTNGTNINPFPSNDYNQDEYYNLLDENIDMVAYTTADGDDNNAVRDGLKTKFEEYIQPQTQVSLSQFYTLTTGTNYIQFTTKAENNLYPNGSFYCLGFINNVQGNEFVDMFDTNVLDMDVSNDGQITTFKPGGDVYEWKPLSTPSQNIQYGFSLQTADMFGESVGQRKKVHKVYISYKCTGSPNVFVKFITDGKHNDFSNRKLFSSTKSTNYGSNGLSGTSGDWATAELIPDTSSDSNNIYTFRLLFEGLGGTPEDFSINDINIVYRVKNVK